MFTSATDFLILCASFPIVYHNADSQKKEIYLNSKGKSGVYMWVNTINGKRYVGSSVNLQRRFSAYYSVAYLTKYNTTLIHRALLKYGYSAFSLYILEYCKEEDLIKREQDFMDLYNPEYNILKTAGNSLGVKPTEEWNLKNSLDQPKSIKVTVTDVETNVSTTYGSMDQAARAIVCMKAVYINTLPVTKKNLIKRDILSNWVRMKKKKRIKFNPNNVRLVSWDYFSAIKCCG